MLEQLNESVVDVLQGARDPDKVYVDEDLPAARLCFVLEKVAHHGIKAGVFSRVSVWQFFKNLDGCLPGGQSPLELATSIAKTDIGMTLNPSLYCLLMALQRPRACVPAARIERRSSSAVHERSVVL